MNMLVKRSLALAALAMVAQASAQVTLYEGQDFRGRSFTAQRFVDNLEREGFNDRASSLVVEGGPWEACQDAFFRGPCVVLRAGRYASLDATGLNDRISSVRRVDANAPNSGAPQPPREEITFFGQEGLRGRSFSTAQSITNLEIEGFNDRASSVLVTSGTWEVCSAAGFSGRCAVLRPGEYASLTAMGLNDSVSSVRRLEPAAHERPRRPAPPVLPSATFYERQDFRGRSFTTGEEVLNFNRGGLRSRAGSVDVAAGRWEVCEDRRYGGHCMLLQPGRYPTMASMGLVAQVASARTAQADAPLAAVDERAAARPAYDARRRGNERLFLANVTSVREVIGQAEQRCWIERAPVAQQADRNNVPGALVGALIGGILGHQVGGGSGKDLATAGGAIAGAVVGANVGRDGGQSLSTQDVQRCGPATAGARPSYWEVSYNFRGIEHRVQMNAAPQATITVNERGEPRV